MRNRFALTLHARIRFYLFSHSMSLLFFFKQKKKEKKKEKKKGEKMQILFFSSLDSFPYTVCIFV
jgi:uncharacterized protein YhhL (DUF1145 family)